VTIDMSGKVALVTGGGYGMGRASARWFAECGARVAIADVDEAGGEETVEMIAKADGEACFIKADVSIAAAAAPPPQGFTDRAGGKERYFIDDCRPHPERADPWARQ
jgi:NAD(P)-dependent dehydrogenase (short-subunit alcohol dehydrogenase family)